MKRLLILLMVALCVGWPQLLLAHAFPDHAVPGAGAVLTQAPSMVTIYFDADLEPIFSSLIVRDAQGAQVSEGNGSVDPKNPTMLSTRLVATAKGTYHVYWRVVSRDGHRTEGDYTFSVR